MIDLKAGDRFAAVAPSLNLVGTWKESGGVVNSSTPAVATTTVVMTIVLGQMSSLVCFTVFRIGG